jgi:hypothetical protein
LTLQGGTKNTQTEELEVRIEILGPYFHETPHLLNY